MRKVSFPLIAIFVVTVLFVSVIAETVTYYSGLVSNRDSQITSLKEQVAEENSQISNLSTEVSNLTSEITNLTSADLASTLNVTEEPNNSDLVQMFPSIPVTSIPYDSLWITGSVTNTGHVTAYNAGLHVIGYAADGTLEVNMTVPLVTNAVYGTDTATDALILNNPRLITGNDIGTVHFGQIGPLQLESLAVGQTANVFLAIYHEGIVGNWTVTPVWTNTP